MEGVDRRNIYCSCKITENSTQKQLCNILSCVGKISRRPIGFEGTQVRTGVDKKKPILILMHHRNYGIGRYRLPKRCHPLTTCNFICFYDYLSTFPTKAPVRGITSYIWICNLPVFVLSRTILKDSRGNSLKVWP